jgi:hypothetical protein
MFEQLGKDVNHWVSEQLSNFSGISWREQVNYQ